MLGQHDSGRVCFEPSCGLHMAELMGKNVGCPPELVTRRFMVNQIEQDMSVQHDVHFDLAVSTNPQRFTYAEKVFLLGVLFRNR
ncbi:hypothetical protein D3C84_1036620 [compost metagenome]